MPASDVNALIQQHFDRIHRAAFVLTGNPWDADDLTQETFLRFSRDRDRFEGRSQPYTWLYGILLNLDRHHRRRHGIWRRKFTVLCERMVGQEPSMPPAEAALEAAEWKQSLWAQVDQLPSRQCQALVLRFGAGLAYDEIAEAAGCPLGTVKSRIHHGLLGLRQRLDQNTDVGDVPLHTWEDLLHAF
jgi:RNA polymerase sigma-70 factor (ECF subfamily)